MNSCALPPSNPSVPIHFPATTIRMNEYSRDFSYLSYILGISVQPDKFTRPLLNSSFFPLPSENNHHEGRISIKKKNYSKFRAKDPEQAERGWGRTDKKTTPVS